MSDTSANINQLTAAEIIALKRDDKTFSDPVIDQFVTGITDLSFSDAQVGALAMAITIRGMNVSET
ncbi:MAG: thymidine phosphorylase, partial [Actinobacteria bacterium]|nr:thymidine phosphorylase [Actinomycetota bacterium]